MKRHAAALTVALGAGTPAIGAASSAHRHARYLGRFGTALQPQPRAGVPAPIELDTLASERLCVATRIRDAARLQ